VPLVEPILSADAQLLISAVGEDLRDWTLVTTPPGTLLPARQENRSAS
jgi:hypothetical protein